MNAHIILYFAAMWLVLLSGLLVPFVIATNNEGNLHLLEDDVAAAIRTCSVGTNRRQKRSETSPKIDSNVPHGKNIYAHERRNTNDTINQIRVLNATEYNAGYDNGSDGEKLMIEVPKEGVNRTKRHEPLLSKSDGDQCLSQCVFANLQVVDLRGIPREAELWNIIQLSVPSQQSRAALKDQLRACFQELQSESEEDGCSYSNKLEECLMLQFDDRKAGLVNATTKGT